MLVLELESTPEPNLAALAEINKLDLELALVYIIQIDVFAEDVIFADNSLACIWFQILEQIRLLIERGEVLKNRKGLARDPEAVLILVGRHGDLAIERRNEFL